MNKTTKRILILLMSGLGAGRLFAAPNMVMLKGHIPVQQKIATKLERAPADEKVTLSLTVQLDQTLLDATLADLYSLGAPARKHFLSSAEFAEKFGLAAKRQAIKDFAVANGLTVDPTEDKPESMTVKVSAPSRVVEQAFHVQLSHYRMPDGRVFRGHDTDPMIPTTLVPNLGAVIGLSNVSGLLHPHFHLGKKVGEAAPGSRVIPNATPTQPHFNGSGPGSTLTPSDIATIYGLGGVSLTGTGQKVALFELDGYYQTDINGYETLFGLPNVPLTFVGVDGTLNQCGGSSCSTQDPQVDTNMVEVALDIEMVIALAHGVTQILVYDGPSTAQGIIDTYDRIATDDLAASVSTSWGGPELDDNGVFLTFESQIFQRYAAQGQSFYAASGDTGAFDVGASPSINCNGTTKLCVDDPASQPYATGVGGTSLSGTISSPVESTWNELGLSDTAGGGGVSAVWSIPSYQVGVTGVASPAFRNVPDVSLNADADLSPYGIVVGLGSAHGGIYGVGGTSAAAPLWAAFTALINQGNVSKGNSTMGFANPTLYQLGTGASTFSSNFNDITTGNNGNSTHYPATVGYDDATGFGSFKGAALIDSVSGILAILSLETLANVYAYPNPWDIRKDIVRQVTLANVPNDATVKIFTLSGFWVKTLTPANGRVVWDLTNDHGERVASGLYFYLVSTPGAKIRGEIAIIK